jgi:hypothetical protein
MSHGSPETASVLYNVARNLLVMSRMLVNDFGEVAERGCVVSGKKMSFALRSPRFRNETLAEREGN